MHVRAQYHDIYDQRRLSRFPGGSNTSQVVGYVCPTQPTTQFKALLHCMRRAVLLQAM